jgi:hypothetical protein
MILPGSIPRLRDFVMLNLLSWFSKWDSHKPIFANGKAPEPKTGGNPTAGIK